MIDSRPNSKNAVAAFFSPPLARIARSEIMIAQVTL